MDQNMDFSKRISAFFNTNREKNCLYINIVKILLIFFILNKLTYELDFKTRQLQ